MRALTRLALLAALVWAPACVIHLDGHGPDGLDDAIRAAAAEVNLHHAMMGGAADMDEVRGEVARHEAKMDDRLRRMHREMDDGWCHDHGDMDAMHGTLDQVEAREAAYQAAVGAASTPAEARALCATYGEDMEALFSRMMDRWRSMDCVWEW
jgi:hypothetical protein